MRQAVAISGLLHVLLIVAASVVWPRMIDRTPIEPTMSIELVSISDESRAPKQQKPAPPQKVDPKPVEPPPEAAKIETPPPPAETKPLIPLPPMPKEIPQIKRPDVPAPAPMPVLAIKPQEVPKLEKVDLKKTLPDLPKEHAHTRPVEKPPEKPVEKKPETLDLSKIASTLSKLEKKPDTPAPAQPQPTPQTQQTASLDGGLTMSEKDALRALIGRNWNVPVGAPRPEDLVVIVRFSLNPDGSLSGPPQLVNSGNYATNSFFRAAADAALRAVQMTQPFRLPANKYAEWRNVTLTFDPRDMIGR